MFKWIKKCWESLISKPNYDPLLVKAIGQHGDLCVKYGYKSKEVVQFTEDHKNIPDFIKLSDVALILYRLGTTKAIK